MSLAYTWYEFGRMMTAPARLTADMVKHSLQNPANPLAYSPYAKSMAAACEMFERGTRRYAKPAFGLTGTWIDGASVPVSERVVWEKPFCRVLTFDRSFARGPSEPQPKLLIVAPMSGHYATLLRGTVEAMLPQPSGLHHRLDGCAPRADHQRAVRSRHVYRLPEGDLRRSRAGPSRHGRLSAGGAGARCRGTDGGAGHHAGAALNDPDGRPPSIPAGRLPPSMAWRRNAARNGSSATASPSCR